MIRVRSPRLALALVLCTAWILHAAVAAQRALTSQQTAAAMTTAAQKWLDGLTPDQRQQATLALDNEDRLRWNFIPTNMFPRKGVPIKEMTDVQRKLAHELLKAGLGQRGYLTATAIMELETILHAIENSGGRQGRNVRDPELYFFTVFGQPTPKGAWGWRVEGHHVSLHFTVADNALVANTPAFFGTNPAEVREEGPKKGLRILGTMEDTARALLADLDEKQVAAATINATAPNDIVTGTTVKIDPLTPPGLAAGAMTASQRELLMKVVESYTAQMAGDVAAIRLAAIRQAGVEKIAFAWAGPTEPGKQHYYRVQGPTFLIEYDNTQNNGNHVHSVWRDFNGDFGRDLLREHVVSVAH
ncbi:MAG TPA: DUF3500 domain-containing protein [Vicinamibacterales bacterium]|nr:DUF3500 domain-containing protein [Vicinamibacterales bacterium]